ncbi:hypothetical protein ACFLYB_05220 [Chloroflexota bacterium]
MKFQGFGYRTNSRFADCVKVQVDHQDVEITGVMNPEDSGIAFNSSRRLEHNTPIPFSLKIAA